MRESLASADELSRLIRDIGVLTEDQLSSCMPYAFRVLRCRRHVEEKNAAVQQLGQFADSWALCLVGRGRGELSDGAGCRGIWGCTGMGLSVWVKYN